MILIFVKQKYLLVKSARRKGSAFKTLSAVPQTEVFVHATRATTRMLLGALFLRFLGISVPLPNNVCRVQSAPRQGCVSARRDITHRRVLVR